MPVGAPHPYVTEMRYEVVVPADYVAPAALLQDHAPSIGISCLPHGSIVDDRTRADNSLLGTRHEKASEVESR